MQSRTVAMELAKRGFNVFPIKPGMKEPAKRSWQSFATSDPAEVMLKWPTDRDDYNVGISTSGFVVLDLDLYKFPNAAAEVSKLGDLPPTFTVKTARGGRHLFYRNRTGRRVQTRAYQRRPDGRESFAVLDCRGVDVRADGGLVVGPGSVFEGGAYIVEHDLPVADVPEHLVPVLTAARDKSDDAGAVPEGVTLDLPEAVAKATAYLVEDAPLAVEGSGGDNTTFQVCARLLDFGVTIETGLELLSDSWNERCEPPWEIDDLETKLRNAAKHRQDPIGREQLRQDTFGAIELPPPAEKLNGSNFKDQVVDGALSLEALSKLPPRDWLVPGLLERREMTQIVAPGGSGKSLWTLLAAAAVSLGDGRCLGFDVRRQARVLILSGEDRKEDYHRRLGALCLHHGIDPERFSSTLQVRCPTGGRISLLKRSGKSGERFKSPDFHRLQNFISDRGYGLVIIDPIVKFHELEENSNTDMNDFATVLRELAYETNAAVLAVHHTSKPPQGSSSGFEGNPDAGRGASALKDGARVTATLFSMNTEDAKSYGVSEKERSDYFRVDDGKKNHSRRNSEPQWFKKVGVPLPGSAENVVTAFPVTFDGCDRVEKIKPAVLGEITRAWQDGRPINAAIQGRSTGKKAIAEAIGEPVDVVGEAIDCLQREGAIHLVKGGASSRAVSGHWKPADAPLNP